MTPGLPFRKLLQIDTATDNVASQQCCMVIRYVNNNLEVIERVISFLSVTSTTGESLHKFVIENLNRVGLDITILVVCCTDGASNMCAISKGKSMSLIARLQHDNPLLINS